MGFIGGLDVEDGGPPETVGELRGIFANFAEGLQAFDQMYDRMVGKGRLDQTLRYVILGASARWRRDPYIASAMFGQAIGAGFEADALGELIERVERDDRSTADRALLSFCRKATESAFTMVEADIDALRSHGWSSGEIVEAVTMVSLSGYMTAMSAAGGLLDDENLEPEPWR